MSNVILNAALCYLLLHKELISLHIFITYKIALLQQHVTTTYASYCKLTLIVVFVLIDQTEVCCSIPFVWPPNKGTTKSQYNLRFRFSTILDGMLWVEAKETFPSNLFHLTLGESLLQCWFGVGVTFPSNTFSLSLSPGIVYGFRSICSYLWVLRKGWNNIPLSDQKVEKSTSSMAALPIICRLLVCE